MQNKVVVITGATDGIGKATARGLMRLGAKVAIVGRNPDKAQQVASELGDVTEKDKPSIFIADLSLPSQVKRVALEIKAAFPAIDVLINNAGAFFPKREINQEGFEQTFALNHLNYFLLTHHLLGALQKAPQGRIINVASEAHRRTSLDFSDLQGEKSFNGWKAYQRSKLANIMFSHYLAQRIQGSKVTANSLHPGFVSSRFGQTNLRSGMSLLIKVGQIFIGINEEEGARTPIFLASSPEVSQISGRYFIKCHEHTPSAEAGDRNEQKKLWQVTEELLAVHL